MQTKGLAGFYLYGDLTLAYQNDNAAPEELGLSLLQELKDYRISEKMSLAERTISELCSPDETQILPSGSKYHQEIRRHFPKEMVNEGATDLYNLYAPFQGTLLPYLDGRLTGFPDATDFIRDSEFCEWAYVVDLGNERFDILKGNQTTKPTSIIYNLSQEDAPISYGEKNHYPCAIVQQYKLRDLPSESQFLKDLKAYQ